MQNPVPSLLPDHWLDRIWEAMRATYGAEFDRQWECAAGQDPNEHVRNLRNYWIRELSRFAQNPDAIKFGLENLPDRTPNLKQFVQICNRRPDVPLQRLPPPKSCQTERSKEAVAALQALKARLLAKSVETLRAPKEKPEECIEPFSREDDEYTQRLKDEARRKLQQHGAQA